MKLNHPCPPPQSVGKFSFMKPILVQKRLGTTALEHQEPLDAVPNLLLQKYFHTAGRSYPMS